MAKSSKRLTLGRASYGAQQIGDELLLFANGVHPTAGFKEFFESLTLEGPIPELNFLFIEPERREEEEAELVSVVAQVVTAFQHHERFRVPGRVEGVVIRDLDGRHELVVERFPEVEASLDIVMEGAEEPRLTMEAPPIAPAAAGCDLCVRGTVAMWAGNDSFSNSQTLGQVYRRGSCNNGALSQLFQAIQGRCGRTPLSFSCSTTVRQLIRSTCP